MQRISYQLCNKLYLKGFRERDRKVSKEFCNSHSERLTRLFRDRKEPQTYIVVGSSAEGTGKFPESDFDALLCYDRVKCCEIVTDQDLGSNETVHLMDMRNSPAGYTKIRKYFVSTNQGNVEGCEEKEEREGTGVFLTHIEMRKNIPDFLDIVGPSSRQDKWFHNVVPTVLPEFYTTASKTVSEKFIKGLNVEQDLVPAIKCRSESIMTPWVTRKRLHQWPSSEIIEQVSSMPGYLVPVGPGKTDINPENEYLFRVCFNMGELKLVESLNETQTLLYIFLKQLFKQETGRDSKCMTSYIIKNIVLWLAESVRPLYFQLKFFFPVIYATLSVMKWMVESKHIIPNYMIPSRNMLKEKLDEHQQCILIAKLTMWIQNAHGKKPFGVIDLADIPDTAPDETKEAKIDNAPLALNKAMNIHRRIMPCFWKMFKNPNNEVMAYSYALRYFIKEEDFMNDNDPTHKGACMRESEKDNKKRKAIILIKRLICVGLKMGVRLRELTPLSLETLHSPPSNKQIEDIPLD